ncbi:MAG: hypothetical protein P0S95_02850 [Rhabdochlamydiaceae bacterium]|nr:hypothetical protein [Candidatus Amphrikana amoebophyrae]
MSKGTHRIVKDAFAIAVERLDSMGKSVVRNMKNRAGVTFLDKPVVVLKKIIEFEKRYFRAIGMNEAADRLELTTDLAPQIIKIEEEKHLRKEAATKVVVGKLRLAARKPEPKGELVALVAMVEAKLAETDKEDLSHQELQEIFQSWHGAEPKGAGFATDRSLEIEVLSAACDEFYEQHFILVKHAAIGECNQLFKLMSSPENVVKLSGVNDALGMIRVNEGEVPKNYTQLAASALCYFVEKNDNNETVVLGDVVIRLTSDKTLQTPLCRFKPEEFAQMSAMIKASPDVSSSDEDSMIVLCYIRSALPPEKFTSWMPFALRNTVGILSCFRSGRDYPFRRHYDSGIVDEISPWYLKTEAEVEASVRLCFISKDGMLYKQLAKLIESDGLTEEELKGMSLNKLALLEVGLLKARYKHHLIDLLDVMAHRSGVRVASMMSSWTVDYAANVLVSRDRATDQMRLIQLLKMTYIKTSCIPFRGPSHLNEMVDKVAANYIADDSWGSILVFKELRSRYSRDKLRAAFKIINMDHIEFVREQREGKCLVDVVGAVIANRSKLKKHLELVEGFMDQIRLHGVEVATAWLKR